jgi:RimJ/RimL family protein N-acetyltransferase
VGQFRGLELVDLKIASERLMLRPWRRSDAADLAAVMGTGAMHEFLALPDPYTDTDAAEFIGGDGQVERARGTGIECAVVEHATGRLVGGATLRLPFAMRPADIGYWIGPNARRRGFAVEVADALARWAYDRGVHRVELRVDVANLASARVAMRTGFGFEGVRRDGVRLGDGRHDLAVFVRTAEDLGTPVSPVFGPLPPGGLTDGVVCLREALPIDADGFEEQERDDLTRHTAGVNGLGPPRRAMERMLARARLDWLVGPAAPFTIVDVATNAFAGSLRMRLAGPPQVGGLGYAVHPAFRGRGYTARALKLVVPWAFEQGGFARLELGAKYDNVASQRAAIAGGFEPDGTMAARLRNADGSFSDEVRFALVNPDYSSSSPSRIKP